MTKQIEITDETTIEQRFQEFYSQVFGLDDTELQEQIAFLKDIASRLKGFNQDKDAAVDKLVEEYFWLGVWWSKQYPDTVAISEVEEETAADVADTMFG